MGDVRSDDRQTSVVTAVIPEGVGCLHGILLGVEYEPMPGEEQQRVAKDPRTLVFYSPREERLHGKIQLLLGYGPADFFHDACALMSNPRGLATSAHLVAHLLRELENRLKGMLVVLTKAPELEDHKEIADIRIYFSRLLAALVDLPASDSSQGAAEGKVRVILRALDIPVGSEEARSWIRLNRKNHSFAGRAHMRGLGPTLARNSTLEEDWKQLLKIYEVVLDRFEKKYSIVDPVLDALLAKDVPTTEDLKILKEGVPNNEAAYEYFFGRLQSPKWLKPLAKERFFERIPAPSPSGTHYRCHQLKYLKRMAALPECQEAVLEVVMSVDTENIMALCDLAETAVALPPRLAVKTASKFARCLETSSNLFVLPFDLGDLTKNLAPAHPKEALELAAALLVIKPHEGAPDYWRKPKTRIQTHEYEHALEEAIPPLAESGGLPVLELLCDLLATAVEARHGEGEEREFDDGSSWRHAIDGYDGVYHSHEITNGLITAAYQTAGKIIAKDASAMGRVIAILDTKRWTIFQRIAIQLLCDFENPPPELVAKKLLDENLWDYDATQREYFQLAAIHGDLLSPAQREEIVRKIEAGPDLKGLEHLEQERERLDRVVRGWRWRRLVPFRGILPAPLQRECDDLVTDLGEPVDEDPSAFARSVSSVSPIEKSELQSKSVEEIVAYLRDWVPTGEWEEPDPDGLSGVLRSVVAEEPVRFADNAALFSEADPTYVRNVLGGFGEAIKAKRPFPWEGVLKLCAAVLGKPIQIPGRNARRIFDFDPDWNGARRSVVELVSSGLMEGAASIPLTCRSEVWAVLQPFTQDPDPAPEKETRQNMNPYDEAVNTVRGSAIEAVIFYISWVLREKKIIEGPGGTIERGMRHVPEAEAVLAAHLDRQQETSPLIHTLYGRWLPTLYYTDHDWVERMLPQIFPSDPTLQNLRDGAWNTYLLYSGGPYNKTATMLIPEYRLCSDRIETIPDSDRGDLKRALCIHLSYLYLRGILKLDGDDGTIAAFLQRADAKLRGQLILIMGDIIRHTEKPSQEWIKRAVAFWESRLAAAKAAADRSQHVHEMDAFGYWFVSRKFDDDWTLQNLENALKLGSDIEFDYHVLEHLASMAKTRPVECARCLQLIVTSDVKSDWDIRLLVKQARELLDIIFATGNAEAKVIADEVVSAFLARGQQDIRGL